MKHAAIHTLQAMTVTVALLRGLGEFVSLQRWRLKDWMAR